VRDNARQAEEPARAYVGTMSEHVSNGSSNSLADAIARHSAFRRIAPRYLDLLAQVAMLKEFAVGELLFREGDPANRFYLILEGEVVIESDGTSPVQIETIGPDDVLGWSWLFPPYYWHFDARATQPTKAVFFYGTWLRENCERDHEFGYEMMTRFVPIIIERLQATRKQLVDRCRD